MPLTGDQVSKVLCVSDVTEGVMAIYAFLNENSLRYETENSVNTRVLFYCNSFHCAGIYKKQDILGDFGVCLFLFPSRG